MSSNPVEYEFMATRLPDGKANLLLITDDIRQNHSNLLDNDEARSEWVQQHGTGWTWDCPAGKALKAQLEGALNAE